MGVPLDELVSVTAGESVGVEEPVAVLVAVGAEEAAAVLDIVSVEVPVGVCVLVLDTAPLGDAVGVLVALPVTVEADVTEVVSVPLDERDEVLDGEVRM